MALQVEEKILLRKSKPLVDFLYFDSGKIPTKTFGDGTVPTCNS